MHRRLTDNMWKKEIKLNKYLKSLKKQLSLIYSEDDAEYIIDMVDNRVNSYLRDNPSASMEDIQEYIIHDNELMEFGLENIDPIILEQNIGCTAKEKKKSVITLSIAGCILLLFVIWGIYNIIYSKQTAMAYYTEEIIDYGDIPSTEETDSTDFSSESSSESTE